MSRKSRIDAFRLLWGLYRNYEYVPVDDPQRNEKLNATGTLAHAAQRCLPELDIIALSNEPVSIREIWKTQGLEWLERSEK